MASNIAIFCVLGVASLPAMKALFWVVRELTVNRHARNYSSVFAATPKETLLGSSAPASGDDMPDDYAAGLLYVRAKNGNPATLVRQSKVTDARLAG